MKKEKALQELERFADFSMAEKVRKEIETIPVSSVRKKRSRTGKPPVDTSRVHRKYVDYFAGLLGSIGFDDPLQFIRILDAFESIKLWTAEVDEEFHLIIRRAFLSIYRYMKIAASLSSEPIWNATLNRLGVSIPNVTHKFKGRLIDDEEIVFYEGEFLLGNGFLGFKIFGEARKNSERKTINLEDEDGGEFVGLVRCFVGHTDTYLHMPIFPLNHASIISIPGEMTFKKGRKNVPFDISLFFKFDNSKGFELAERIRSATEKIAPPTGIELHDKLGLHLYISKGRLESNSKYDDRKRMILEHLKVETEKPVKESGWRFAEIFTGYEDALLEDEDLTFSTSTPPYMGWPRG